MGQNVGFNLRTGGPSIKELGDFTTMLLHRIIRLVCFLGATTVPLVAAFICRLISRVAVKDVIPHSGSVHLPALTQTWVIGMADGSLPVVIIACLLSALVAASGLYVLFSKQVSADAVASVLIVASVVSYSVALVSVGSTMIALVLPFIQTTATL